MYHDQLLCALQLERLGTSNFSGGASSNLHCVATEFCPMYTTFVNVSVCVPMVELRKNLTVLIHSRK